MKSGNRDRAIFHPNNLLSLVQKNPFMLSLDVLLNFLAIFYAIFFAILRVIWLIFPRLEPRESKALYQKRSFRT